MDKRTYATLQPTFPLDFPSMSKPELRSYFKWFQEVMPERIRQLTSLVNSSREFEKLIRARNILTGRWSLVFDRFY